MKTTKQIGAAGEEAACEYLEDKGYEILKRNYKTPVGEIDIIAISPDDVCAFVEVKTRRSIEFGLACEAVDRKKREKIIKVAKSYYYKGDMRFDIIEVYYEDKEGFYPTKINHIENAFEAF